MYFLLNIGLNNIRIIFFVILIAAANFAFAEAKQVCPPDAEKPTPEMAQAAMREARDHGFLWRISKDGHSSFLYGTIHVGKFAWMYPGPKVTQALRAADTVAFELDMLDPDMQSRIAQGVAQLRNTVLPEALEQRMRQQAHAVCLPYDSLAKRPPEFQVEALTLMVGHWDGLYAAYGIDMVFAGMAHRANKTVISLETPEMQLQLLQMQDARETIAFVDDSLDELETGRAHVFLSRIARIWESADYAEMSRFNQWCECLNTKIERDMMKRMLDDRNANLADRIDVLHASGKQLFVAIGSLHMFGSAGLPALMELRGYRVEQVDFNPQ